MPGQKAAAQQLAGTRVAAQRGPAQRVAAQKAAAQKAVAVRRAAATKAAAKKRAAVLRASPPSLREERRLLREGHTWLAAVDEVGRGALAGPVSVGVVLIGLQTGSAPSGVRDSKLLTPQAREKIAPRLKRWAPHHAVGHTDPAEIDRIGIIAGLRLAACRALASLPVRPDLALLDGNHNWLHAPLNRPFAQPLGTQTLFELDPDEGLVDLLEPSWTPPRVVTQIKADMRCAAVAAASVLAKVERDQRMIELSARHPEYRWAENKGYSAPEHIEAIRRFGVTPLHRQSWSLPGLESVDGAGPGQVTIEDFGSAFETEHLDLDAAELTDGELDAADLDAAEAELDAELTDGELADGELTDGELMEIELAEAERELAER